MRAPCRGSGQKWPFITSSTLLYFLSSSSTSSWLLSSLPSTNSARLSWQITLTRIRYGDKNICTNSWENIISEILYNVRSSSEAPGSVCPRDPDRCPLPHLEARHLPALRKLHHASHYPQHSSSDVQGNFMSEYLLNTSWYLDQAISYLIFCLTKNSQIGKNSIVFPLEALYALDARCNKISCHMCLWLNVYLENLNFSF